MPLSVLTTIIMFMKTIDTAGWPHRGTGNLHGTIFYPIQPQIMGSVIYANGMAYYNGMTPSGAMFYPIQPQIMSSITHTNGMMHYGTPFHSAQPQMAITAPPINIIQQNIHPTWPQRMFTATQVNGMWHNGPFAYPAEPCTTTVAHRPPLLFYMLNANPQLNYMPIYDGTNYILCSFEICGMLGAGSSGAVYLTKSSCDDKYYAIKEICIHGFKNNQLINYDEVAIQYELRECPFIAKLCTYVTDSNHLWIVMEYYEKGDLFSCYRRQGEAFPEYTVKMVCAQLLMALEYIHDRDIAHNDIKVDNILVDDRGYIKLTDFGLSMRINNSSIDGTKCGTYRYLSPEKILKIDKPRESDYWAFAVVMYTMLTGKFPFSSAIERKKICEDILKCHLTFPSHVSHNARDLLTKLFRKDLGSRLNYINRGEILGHPFFHGVNWVELRNLK